MAEETSESGAPIRRYESPANPGWTPPDMSGSSMDAIERHIEAHIGKVDSVLHEILSDLVHIDIHIVRPTEARPCYTLITSGMSDLAMTVSPDFEGFKYAELMLCLPASWPIDSKEDIHYWPFRWLTLLARFPHRYKTWLGDQHSMPNGDPPESMAADTKLCGVMLGRPMTVSTRFHRLEVSPEKTIHFYSVLPLYPDELDFKLKAGGDALIERFERAKVTEVLNPHRPGVLSKPWWKLF